MLPPEKLRSALAKAELVDVRGPWWRAVGFRHLLTAPPGSSGRPQPLWGGASARDGARFTPPGGFDSIYLASDALTAFAEVQVIVFLPGGPASVAAAPWTLVAVKGVVHRVLDLTEPKTLAVLGTNAAEIGGDWQLIQHPPTHVLAREAFRSESVSGIRYPSVRNTGVGMNLVVFPDRLTAVSNDFLEVLDPHGHLSQRIGS